MSQGTFRKSLVKKNDNCSSILKFPLPEGPMLTKTKQTKKKTKKKKTKIKNKQKNKKNKKSNIFKNGLEI